VWKTNSGDGAYKVYFYDANGNETASIQTAGADFSNLTIDQVIALSDTQKYPTISQYDRRNQLIATYQPKLPAAGEQAAIEQFVTERASATYAGGTAVIGQVVSKSPSPISADAPGIIGVTTLSATVVLRYQYTGNGTGLENLPGNTLYINVPDLTNALGSGDFQAHIYLNPIYGNGAFLPGYDSTVTAPNGTSLAFGFSEWGSWPHNGFDPPFIRNYSFDLYKQTATGLVYLGSGSGSTNGPATHQEPGLDYCGNPIFNTVYDDYPYMHGTSSTTFTFGTTELDFRNQSPTANLLVLQYRPLGSNAGWSTIAVPQKTGGWFGMNWSGIPAGVYEIWYTTLEVNGASGNATLWNSQHGSMTIGASPSISAPTEAKPLGGAGRAFMGADGKLNILEQGATAHYLTVRYRHLGTSEAWTTAATLSPAI
jgi:hypothetical protein